MSLLSVTLTFFLIANPLRMVLTAMQKAVKFDFSAISDGSMKTRRSIVAEVGDIQEKFMELLTTFSKALKANKALVTGSRRVSSSTGNENNNDKAPLRRNEK
ncbi:hypothetical protein M427DRAFT_158788 [Gonapodya prolifera JEL478]|uniref:Uncharacterized protein n=1 Tax=Gonapodya prolifera (strain JEL478) TaxID=1344416 RepID=A0A139A1X2_GONPJ|nr:hypothetical protein M427DRAFT_158788 [Gonapodya prolifera JEL478]|eukprot:KXS10790.1 hypothetical protein M427DRAFT_158788 [Gonapodya prolifera JEL478]